MKAEKIKFWMFLIFFYSGMLFVSVVMRNMVDTQECILMSISILLVFIAGLAAGLLGCEQK